MFAQSVRLLLLSYLAVAQASVTENNLNGKSADVCTKVPVTLEATWDGSDQSRPVSPYLYEWTISDLSVPEKRSAVWKGVSSYNEKEGKLSEINKRFLSFGVHRLEVRVKKTLKHKPGEKIILDDFEHPNFVLKVGDRIAGYATAKETDADGVWVLKFVTTLGDCPALRPIQNHRVLQSPGFMGGSFPIKVQIEGDAFPDENTWTVMRRVVEGGTTRFVPILYSETGVSGSVAVAPGDYAFEMTDSAGDGICCSFGLGIYRLTVGETTAYIGGEFGFTTGLLEFTVTPTGGVMLPDAAPSPAVGPASPTIAPTGEPTMFDPCLNAIPIEDISALGMIRGSNEDAPVLTEDSPAAQCEIGGSIFAPGATRVVYYSFLGDGCPYTVDTINPNTNFDTVLGLLGSETGCEDASCIIWDDDSEGLLSRISFETVPGVNYWIIVGGFFEGVGDYVLTISGGCGGPAPMSPTPAPVGDSGDCEDAPEIPLRPRFEIPGSTAGIDVLQPGEPATLCQSGPSFQAGSSRALYYLVVGDGCTYSADLENSNYDTALGLLTGDDCDSATCIGFNDDTVDFGLQSRIFFTTEPGVPYWILVGGFASDFGDFTLRILLQECDGVSPTPSPSFVSGVEDCEEAETIEVEDEFQIEGSTEGVAILTPGAPATACQLGSNIFGTRSSTIYYFFVGDGYTYTADTRGSNFDTTLGLLGGESCEDVECIVVNDDFFGVQSQITFSTISGEPYWLILGGFGRRTGNYVLTFGMVTPSPAPSMSPTFAPVVVTCENATAVELIDGFQTEGSTAAVPPLMETDPAAACNMGSSTLFAPGTSSVVYYTFVGDGCRYSFDTRSSNFDTVLGILQGDCDDFFCVDRNDDTFGLQSRIILETEMDVDYIILLGGYFRSRGNYVLNIERFGACGPTTSPTMGPTFMLDAAACDNATSIDLFPGSQEDGSTLEIAPLPQMTPASACQRGSLFNPGSFVVYYSFLGDGCRYSIDTRGSNYDTVLGVIDGCMDPNCLAVNDDAFGVQSQVTLATEVDVTYWLILGGFGLRQGNYVVNFDLDGPCGPTTSPTIGPTTFFSANACDEAEEIPLDSERPIQFIGNNDVPMLSGNSPATECQRGGSIFAPGRTRANYYRFTGDGCDYVADTRSTRFDTVLGVLAGPDCDNVRCLVVNDDFFGLQSRVAFSTVEGAPYWFIVGGFGTRSGEFVLNIRVDPFGNCGDGLAPAVGPVTVSPV